MNTRIVVTGATGTIGRRVVEGLLRKGLNVVAMVRDPSKGASLEALGARLVPGSFEDAASMESAFAGADTLVSITPANARAIEQTLGSIEAAKRAKVRKIVRISALHANPQGPTDNTRQHGRAEAALRGSGLAHVILRPHLFMQNLLASLPTILSEGKIYWGVGEARMGMIDTRDASDAAVAAAITSAHDGAVIELTGPAAIDYHQAAAAVGRALGREVTYVPVPPEAAAAAAQSFGADEWTVGIIRDYCRAYSSGFGDFTTDGVERVTGNKPRSIDDFAREVLAPAARGGH